MTSSRVHMKRIALLPLAVLALAAAGCGSGSDDNNNSANPSNNGSGSGSSADTRTSENAGTTGGGGGKTVTIDMKNIQFNPSSASVKVGQTVKWVNEDEAPHNVKGGPLNSKTFGKGGSFEFTPKKAETISYVCTIHPNMKATLTVTS
jgi:plastocyanin